MGLKWKINEHAQIQADTREWLFAIESLFKGQGYREAQLKSRNHSNDSKLAVYYTLN